LIDISAYICHIADIVRPADSRNVTHQMELDKDHPYFDTASTGSWDKLRDVMRREKIPVDATDQHGRTALIFATADGNEEVVQWLIAQKADVNMQSASGWAALHDAANYGHLRIMKMLIDARAVIDMKNNDQETPLMRAVLNGQSGAVQMLVACGAKLDDAENEMQWTPLMCAIYKKDLACVKILLDAGADIDFVNHQEQSAETLAKRAGGQAVALLDEARIKRGCEKRAAQQTAKRNRQTAFRNYLKK
jgi:ankyrin repeat protein